VRDSGFTRSSNLFLTPTLWFPLPKSKLPVRTEVYFERSNERMYRRMLARHSLKLGGADQASVFEEFWLNPFTKMKKKTFQYSNILFGYLCQSSAPLSKGFPWILRPLKYLFPKNITKLE